MKTVKFTLEIETGNDAMQSLRSIEGGRILDLNGNSVGQWEIS
jgi:hypothetical protein